MKKIAVILVLIAGTLWGIIGYFVRGLQSQGLNSMQIVVIRMSLAAVMFSIFAVIFDRKIFRIKLKHLWCFLGTGIVSVATFSFCYFMCMTYASLSVASILLYTAPIFVMLMSVILFREKLNMQKIVSLVLAFCGCLLVTGVFVSDTKISVAGIIFGLLSGLCYALYSIFSRFALNRDYSPMTITLYTFIFASIASLCVTDIKPVITLMTKSTGDLVFCLLFALLSAVLPYLTYTLSLKYIKASTASIMATVEPVVATITGAIIYHEAVPFPLGYIGIAFVLISVILININIKKKAHE